MFFLTDPLSWRTKQLNRALRRDLSSIFVCAYLSNVDNSRRPPRPESIVPPLRKFRVVMSPRFGALPAKSVCRNSELLRSNAAPSETNPTENSPDDRVAKSLSAVFPKLPHLGLVKYSSMASTL